MARNRGEKSELPRYTEHPIRCVEVPAENPDTGHLEDAGFWYVICDGGCRETDPKSPNFGGPKVWNAPHGEEQATRIAFDHLSKLGFVPKRMGSRLGR